MAKKVKEQEDTVEIIADELDGILARLRAVAGVEEEEDETEDGEDEGEESEDSEEEGEFPDTDEIGEMSESALKELAEQVGLEEDLKKVERKRLLLLISEFGTEEDLKKADAKKLLTAFGIDPGKKHADNITLLTELFADSDEDGEDEESEDEESEDEESEDEDEESSEEASSEDKDEDDEEADEEESEEFDAAEVAAASKNPKLSIMKERLAAYNECADEEYDYDPKKKDDVTEAYDDLKVALVNSEGGMSEWGEPYIDAAGEEAVCCGLPLSDDGECSITGKKFDYDEDSGEFSEKAAKKTAKKKK